MDTIATFTSSAETVERTLARVAIADLAAPGLGVWSVGELIAHLIRAADRISSYAEQDPGGPSPTCDRVSYFDFDLAGAAEGIADRSREDAQRIGPAALVDRFSQGWRRSVEVAQRLGGDHLIHTFRGPMTVSEYSATRVLELVVHHLDLCRALDLPATPDPDGLRLTEQILDALLDGPRPAGLDGVDWVLAATGREPSDDPRLPVLS